MQRRAPCPHARARKPHPTVSAVAELQRSLAVDGVLDILGPGGDQVLAGKGLPAGLACDEDPEITAADLCGHEFAAEAHFAWTDHPGDHPGPISSGKLDLVRAVVGEPDCGALVDLEESAEFELSLALPQGRAAVLTGSIHGESQRDLAAGVFTRTASIAATRTISAGGDVVHAAELAGELEISVVFGDDGPVRTVSGDLTISFGDDEDATVSLQGVIHAPKGACAWPTAGTMVRTLPDATVHNLSFGPSCGEATLDGEPVDLDALQAEGHGRRGRHRPF